MKVFGVKLDRVDGTYGSKWPLFVSVHESRMHNPKRDKPGSHGMTVSPCWEASLTVVVGGRPRRSVRDVAITHRAWKKEQAIRGLRLKVKRLRLALEMTR